MVDVGVAEHQRVDGVRRKGKILVALPGFLAATGSFSLQPPLGAMAIVEWAIATAFDAADAPAEPLTALAAVAPTAWPGMRLHPHPTLVRIDLVVDVPGVWQRLDRGEAAGEIPDPSPSSRGSNPVNIDACDGVVQLHVL